MDRIQEIQARLAAINNEIDTAEGETLTALETESRALLSELEGLQADAQKRQQLRGDIARGVVGTPVPMKGTDPDKPTEAKWVDNFAKTRSISVDADQSRAVLISGGTLVQPTKIDGINDIPGAKVSSIIDLVKVENCTGMGSHRIAYTNVDAGEAADHVEGGEVGAGTLGGWDFVDIKPQSVAVIDYISKQAKKQTTLQYGTKVRQQALLALRKKAARIATNALKESELVEAVPGTPGEIEATTLRRLVLGFGDDESVLSGAMLFLNKKDLIAFGDVRGTNEKKAIYTITPDGNNPNTGTISEGGISVRYCINSGLTALCEATESAGKTMFYGDPQALEVDLFSDYEIKVSEDFAINKLMDTIVGDVELGADVIKKGAFVAIEV